MSVMPPAWTPVGGAHDPFVCPWCAPVTRTVPYLAGTEKAAAACAILSEGPPPVELPPTPTVDTGWFARLVETEQGQRTVLPKEDR